MVLCLLSSSSALLQSDLCGLWGPQYHGFGLPEDSAVLGRGRAKDREGREWFSTMIAVGDILLTGGTFFMVLATPKAPSLESSGFGGQYLYSDGNRICFSIC